MKHETTLLLAINRLRFLSLQEKLLLTEKTATIDRFAALSRDELHHFIGRTTRVQNWNPHEIRAVAEDDRISLTRGEFACTFYWEATYPPLLRETYSPPYLLYYRGSLPDPEKPCVAIVGTRYPTGRGRKAAFKLALELGSAGIPVASGLAKGIDVSAHLGNVRGGGRSVAVLGCGIDRIYPESSAKAARELIGAGGCIFSEYAPGLAPLRYHFPERNRIISGLSRSVVVVEAPEKSGALITADFALSQGRDLLVHRECVAGATGRGAARLADEGARKITCAADIVADWGFDRPHSYTTEKDTRQDLERELEGHLVAYAGDYFERNNNG